MNIEAVVNRLSGGRFFPNQNRLKMVSLTPEQHKERQFLAEVYRRESTVRFILHELREERKKLNPDSSNLPVLDAAQLNQQLSQSVKRIDPDSVIDTLIWPDNKRITVMRVGYNVLVLNLIRCLAVETTPDGVLILHSGSNEQVGRGVNGYDKNELRLALDRAFKNPVILIQEKEVNIGSQDGFGELN